VPYYWLVPLLASVVLAFWLRPLYLFILGLTTTAGFIFVAFYLDERIYGQCELQCPPREHRLVVISGVLFLLASSLFLVALAKYIFSIWRRHRAAPGFSAKPS
jgi:hypothetical protein